MITDPIFYRLFESSPETLFLFLGMSLDAARAMAARYEFQAIEFKDTSHRKDGVFLPKEPGLPVYFLEVQIYLLPSVYADLLVKAYTYLKQNDPGQEFVGVVLFADRSLEPAALAPYRPLLDAGLIRRFYLDQMRVLADAPLGVSIIALIQQSESDAPIAARELIARAKSEVDDAGLRQNLIELIETVILYRLPLLSREEIQAMLKVDDIRKSRVYQEALQEGRQEGRQEGYDEATKNAIAKMAANRLSAKRIAAILDLDLELVKKVIANLSR